MFPDVIEQLITAFSKLPGVGRRQATRYVFALLKLSQTELALIAQGLEKLKNEVEPCRQCLHIARKKKGGALCLICSDKNRNEKQIAVVERISDLEAIERTKAFRGMYHVLGGTFSSLTDKTPFQQTPQVQRLIKRLKLLREKYPKEKLEVILALNPTQDGDLTASMITELIKPYKLTVSRIGRGIPTGGEMEYMDELTLGEAIKRRSKL